MITMRDLIRIVEGARLHEQSEFIPALYHGTTSLHHASIMRDGLIPQVESKSPFRGNSSFIPGWTDRTIYLTDSVTLALRYAAQQAKRLGGKPIIYDVEIRDPSLLVADDDFILNRAKELASEQGLSAEEALELAKKSPWQQSLD